MLTHKYEIQNIVVILSYIGLTIFRYHRIGGYINMYENYTTQSLPSREYRELLGSAICVFNSNNTFIIENILHQDHYNKYNWHNLIDSVSGRLIDPIKHTITTNSNNEISDLFNRIIQIRNRIIHSFQVTAPDGITNDADNQILATKYKEGNQEYIDEKFLLNFIKMNEDLSNKLHELRGG
jgi:hypothetical protein